MYTFPFVPFRYSKTLTIGIVILVLCVLPSSEFSNIKVPLTFTDVIVHFLMFFAFSGALFLDITKKRAKRYKILSILVVVVIISFALGAITELLQYFIVPLNRSGSLGDLLSDFIGSLTGASLIAIIKRRSFVAS